MNFLNLNVVSKSFKLLGSLFKNLKKDASVIVVCTDKGIPILSVLFFLECILR